MKRVVWVALWISLLTLPAYADQILPPVSDRFAAADVHEVPDFQRHVVPLLGRLGCNGRACHGSFQGQGGFRLSLFGYDFAADHEGLTGGTTPRVDLAQPHRSLILEKPTMAIDHDGGKRFDLDGWQHRLLLGWIAAGARGLEAEPQLTALHVEPREIVFQTAEQTRQLKVVAQWSDGWREDVTPLCRFRTNDESIANVSESGLVTALGKGDTHVVAFYDNGITAVPAMLPVSARIGSRYPSVATPTRIDELVVGKLRKIGVVPSDLCTDAEFLRRASLDVTGTLPTADEVAAFLADPSADKRARKIDELLSRPTYAAWWATQLGDWTGNTEQNLPIGGEQSLRRQKSEQWYDWLYRRVEQNVPYDQIVAGMVVAVSRRPEQTEQEYYEEMSSYFRRENPADFAAREAMEYFWSPGRFSPPKTLRFSYAFLGVRLECAECHKHPYDQWTKDDYDQFQAFFDGVRYTEPKRESYRALKMALGLTADQDSGQYKSLFAKLAQEGNVVPWKEVVVPAVRRQRNRPSPSRKVVGGRVITPKLLGGEEVVAAEYDDPREPVMQWLRQADNPYFARTIVNRVWAHYLGLGIVDPPDDMNLANPPSNEPLLDYLAEGFIAHGYDLKWLHREITASHAYQRSWRPNDTNELDERNFSRALVRRLPAEVTYDALVHATAAEDVAHRMHTDPATVRSRSIGVSSGYSRSDNTYALKLFGKPERDQVCDCQRSNEPTLLQTVYLRNDAEVLGLLDRSDGWLKQLARAKSAHSADDLIRGAYLRTLSRLPDVEEQEIAREHLASDPVAGLRDLMWVLLNTKEFILNH